MLRPTITSLIIAAFLSVLLSGCGPGDSTQLALVAPGLPSLKGHVYGSVRYEDKLYGQNGFIGMTTVPKPVRYAEIDVVDSSSGMILARGATDSGGGYDLTYPLPGTNAVHVRVNARTDPEAAPAVEILNNLGLLHSVAATIIGENMDILITASTPTGGVGEVFNVLDVLTAGAELVKHLDPAITLAPLTAYWYPSSTGTYYAPGGGITVMGSSGQDSDGYDDDVIWHEYGHYAADRFSRLQSPMTQHVLSDNTQDLRLSWSEGWADSFPLAVKSWLGRNNGSTLSAQGIPFSMYVDTAQVDTSTLNWSFDFANPPAGTSYHYASSESAVAKILWDVMASPSLGMQAVWDVFVSLSGLPSGTRINLEAFWDQWLAVRAPATPERMQLASIFAGRSVYYLEDGSEPDDDAAASKIMSVPSSQVHYLYKAGGVPDRDIASFSVSAADVSANRVFSIFTNNLSNGADTFLALYDGSFRRISGKENDNYPPLTVALPPNDSTSLASFVTFTAAVPGTYYIEVTSSPVAPVSAGRYGTYTLNIR